MMFQRYANLYGRFILLLGLTFSLLVLGTRYLNSSNNDDDKSKPVSKDDLTDHISHDQKFERLRTTGNPIFDFTIRTWRGDGHWLIYCLRSIEKFVPKAIYRTIIITYNEREDSFFKSFLPQFQYTLPLKIIPQRDTCIRPGPNQGGYYSTMWSKYHTDLLSDADYFIHVDSDTIFNRPVSLSDFVDQQYRVYVKKVPFSNLTAEYLKWKTAAQELLNESVTYETMTRFPFIYPRDLYINIRKHIEQVHKRPFLQVARTTRYFSDHSSFGAYLIAHMPERYVDYAADADVFIYQSWSWGGFNPELVTFYECVLRAKNQKYCLSKRAITTTVNKTLKGCFPNNGCGSINGALNISSIFLLFLVQLSYLLLNRIDFQSSTR